MAAFFLWKVKKCHFLLALFVMVLCFEMDSPRARGCLNDNSFCGTVLLGHAYFSCFDYALAALFNFTSLVWPMEHLESPQLTNNNTVNKYINFCRNCVCT